LHTAAQQTESESTMRYEKSCGAVCVRKENGSRFVLMVRHIAGGHWAFPKGHVEGDECEPQTALREVLEETGVHILLLPGFRFVTSYSPTKGTMKKVVYFAARPLDGEPTPQPGEIEEAKYFEVNHAMSLLTHVTDRQLLEQALSFMDETGKSEHSY